MLNVPVIERIVHKGYSPFSRSQQNDIALLRLNQTVKFTSWIKPICLPNISMLRDIDYGSNYTLIASGWGQVCFLAIQYFLLRILCVYHNYHKCSLRTIGTWKGLVLYSELVEHSN